ncbi:MAG: hypothetical protein RL228_1103 [Actinomycetota bacterium]
MKEIEDFTGWAISPAVFEFLEWVEAEAERAGISRIWFASREGDFLGRAWNTLPRAIPGEYLPLSRAFLFRINLLNPGSFDELFNRSFSGTRGEFLHGRLAISPTHDFLERENSFFRARFRRRDIEVIAQKIDELQKNYSNELLESAHQFLNFLNLEPKMESIAIVDVGYSGTIQDQLEIFLGRELAGYYMMTSPGTKRQMLNSQRKRGWMLEEASWIKSLALRNSMELENLLQSSTGRLIDFQSVNGTTTPIFEDRHLSSKDASILEMQEVSLGQIKNLDRIFGRSWPEESGKRLLAAALEKPYLIPKRLIQDSTAKNLDEYSYGAGVL